MCFFDSNQNSIKIGLEKNLTEIDVLSRFLNSLILLTHAQAGSNFEHSCGSARGVVMSAQQQVIENYDKYINFSCIGADVELLCHQGSLERIGLGTIRSNEHNNSLGVSI